MRQYMRKRGKPKFNVKVNNKQRDREKETKTLNAGLCRYHDKHNMKRRKIDSINGIERFENIFCRD